MAPIGLECGFSNTVVRKMTMTLRLRELRVVFLVLFLSAFFFCISTSCGGGQSNTTSSHSLLTISVVQTAATLNVGKSISFSATVGNAAVTGVSWSVQEGAVGGTITNVGVYTAPTTPGIYHVIATAQADTSKSAIVTVTVIPAVSITVSQQTATLVIGHSQMFAATVSNASDTTVAWSVQESFGGGITSAGLYTAPIQPGTYHIIASSVADPDASATIAVVVINSTITTFAGAGTSPYPGDNGPATSAQLKFPTGLAFDAVGNLYIADADGFRIRKVNAATGVITTIAGTGTQGTSGDNGPAVAAQLYGPTQVKTDATGNLYVADFSWVREVNASTAILTTIAGRLTSYGFSGDGGPAMNALLFSLGGLTFDSIGNLVISDSGNLRIREIVTATGVINTFAGNGTQGYAGDNGPATAAMLNYPYGITGDKAGNIYIADTLNNVIREVAASSGVITTIAGTGNSGYKGDGGPASGATLNGPHDVVVDKDSNLYVADTGNNVIRKIAASTGIITTVVGNGTPGYSGDGGIPTGAQLKNPWALALDSAGNLYIADPGNSVVRKVEW
jgi:NHL repeat